MNLEQLNDEFRTIKKLIGDTFLIPDTDIEKLVSKSKPAENIKKSLDALELKNKLEIDRKELSDKRKEASIKHKEEVEADRKELDDKINTKTINKLKNQDIEHIDDRDKKEFKTTTKTASKEIRTLLGNMINRKEITNRISGLDINVIVENRLAILVVEDIKLFKLSVDGEGSMSIFLDKSDISKKVFRAVIMPLLRALDDYLGNLGINLSNRKDATEAIVFNPSKQIYVSSPKIKNKAAKPGQTIIFTNLKKGIFTIK